jgi:hypothetical protein
MDILDQSVAMYNENNELVQCRSERDWRIRLLASPEVWYEQTRCLRPEEASDVRGGAYWRATELLASEHERKMWLAQIPQLCFVDLKPKN